MHVQMHRCRHRLKVGVNMREYINGMSADSLHEVSWRKSRYSGANGNCVEIARLSTGEIAMRNSRFPQGPALVYTQAEMTAFLAGAKDGEFDGVLD